MSEPLTFRDQGASPPHPTPTAYPQAGPAEDHRAPPGYAIERELGRGGMGVVYLSRSLALQRPCALKLILAGAHSGAADIKRFKIEAQAIARLQHPGIVQVFEVGEYDGKPFMALEYCGGGSLDELLARDPLPPRDAAALVQKLAEAIQAAHDAHVLHRDLKPANVLLASPGRQPGEFHPELQPKVIDFGLARKMDEQGPTQTGNILGTPSYMAPEQAEGRRDHGPAVDVYALGAILYECLTGRPPFKAATPVDTLVQVIADEPVSLRDLNAQVPVDLETIAHKCLQKEPSKRYGSARALADDLGRYLRGEPIVARPIGALERATRWVRRNRLVAGLAGAVFLTLLAGMIVSGYFAFVAGMEADAARRAEGRANDETILARQAEEAARQQKLRAEAEQGRAEAALAWTEGLVYAGNLSLAQSAFADGDAALAMRHLNDCQWDLRGWEYDHLWGRLSPRLTFRGHGRQVRGVAYSPDGRHVATASEDRTARVWDVESGRQVLLLEGHRNVVTSVAYSPDGARLATVAEDSTVRIWDALRGKSLVILRGRGVSFLAAAFSPDGKRLVTGNVNSTAIVWDATTGQQVRTLRGHARPVVGVAWSPDGKRIVTGSEDLTARVWDAQSGRLLATLTGHTKPIMSVAVSPDSRRILTGAGDGTGRLWDADSGRQLLRIEPLRDRNNGQADPGKDAPPDNGGFGGFGGDDPPGFGVIEFDFASNWVLGVGFSPDGRRLVTVSNDGVARFWDADGGNLLMALKGVWGPVAFSPDGRRLVSTNQDDTARLWDAVRGQEVRTLQSHRGAITGMAVSRDGKRLATVGQDFATRICDIGSGQSLLALGGEKAFDWALAYSPDGKHLAGSSGPTVRVLDAGTGQLVHEFKGHTKQVFKLAYSPDGKSLASAADDNTVIVWEAGTGRQRFALVGHAHGVVGVAWSPDGKRLATASRDTTARVWDGETGQELLCLRGQHGAVTGVAWSPDGNRLAAGVAATARIWDARDGTPLLTLKGHTSVVEEVAWSPDGRRLVTGGLDQTVRLWDARTGQETLTLKVHADSLAWAPDGRGIVTAGPDGLARLWEADRTQADTTLTGLFLPLRRVGFSADGRRLFAWYQGDEVQAWSAEKGLPVEPTDPPPLPTPGPSCTPDGTLIARSVEGKVVVTDTRRLSPPETWPLPDRDDRLRFHREQAAAAEKAGKWFAVAFHVGRLLLDDPDNADLKKRRDEALRRHTATTPENQP